MLFVNTLPYCPHGSTNWTIRATEKIGYSYGLRKFKHSDTRAAIELLGGESRIIKELSAGANPFESWLLSQGENNDRVCK